MIKLPAMECGCPQGPLSTDQSDLLQTTAGGETWPGW